MTGPVPFARTVAAACLALGWTAGAAAQTAPAAAKVLAVQGGLQYEQPPVMPARVNMLLSVGGTVRTDQQGRAVLLLMDETQIKVNANTEVKLTGVRAASTLMQRISSAAGQSQESVLTLGKGQIWLRARNKPTDVKVTTPAVTAAIRGTEFDLRVADDGESVITVLDGAVDFSNNLGRVLVNSGEQGRARIGEPPSKTVLVNPADAVQWTLVYTGSVSQRDVPAGAEGALAAVRQASVDLRSGDPAAARSALEAIASGTPGYSQAQSLLSNVYLVQNRKADARAAAERAIAAQPDSPTAHLALSLVLQSEFDLDAATRSAGQARELDPAFEQANVQYATLLFGAGNTARGEEILRGVIARSPGESLARSALGFVLLARARTPEARAEFEQAIALNSAQGEPHLGLGILAMREGRHEDAVEEFLEAATLDPRRSLYETYLAKALYELRRFDQAFAALASAKRLDPRDPTPYLYAGLYYNDLNRPAEAVRELEESIRLNDGRAVYRSRFVLDEDRATRNVGLANAYGKLGLDAWANFHAIGSEADDPANSAAHLFLANTFSNLKGRVSAFGSELLTARLLMPANANSFNAFNDYTTLFDQPRLNVSLGGALASFRYRLGEVVATGGNSRVAFSTLTSYERTDGFRLVNDDSRNASEVALVKAAATPKSDLLLLYQHQGLRGGDHSTSGLNSIVSETSNNPNRRSRSDLDRFEAGFHAELRPGSSLLAVVRGQWSSSTSTDPLAVQGFFTRRRDTTDDYVEYQAAHLLKVRRAQVRYGLDVYAGRRTAITADTPNVFFLDPSASSSESPVRYRTAFVQTHVAATRRVTLTGGLDYVWANHDDAFESSGVSSMAWNPNVGVIVKPRPSASLRAAVMSVRQTQLGADRLAPTHLFGFPLLQNDTPLTETTAYNAGWDQRLGASTFIRAEVVRRNRSVPIGDSCATLLNCTGRLFTFNGVVNRLIGRTWSVVAEYGLSDAIDVFGDRRDHETRGTLIYVHPSGIRALFTGNYLDQEGTTFEGAALAVRVFTANASVLYELPAKRGVLSFRVSNLTDRRYTFMADPFALDPRVPRRELSLFLRVNF